MFILVLYKIFLMTACIMDIQNGIIMVYMTGLHDWNTLSPISEQNSSLVAWNIVKARHSLALLLLHVSIFYRVMRLCDTIKFSQTKYVCVAPAVKQFSNFGSLFDEMTSRSVYFKHKLDHLYAGIHPSQQFSLTTTYKL